MVIKIVVSIAFLFPNTKLQETYFGTYYSLIEMIWIQRWYNWYLELWLPNVFIETSYFITSSIQNISILVHQHVLDILHWSSKKRIISYDNLC